MNGLFDKLRSAATSPLALGLLGGAAVGSPGFGLLLAPVIGAARENAARNKTAAEQALEARALELERARRAEQGAQGLIAALSAPTVPDIMVGPPRPGVMRETDFRQSPQGLLLSAAQMNPAAVGETLLSQMTAQPEPPPNLRGTAGYLQQFLGRIPTPDEVIEYERRLAGAQPEDPREALAREQLAQLQAEQTEEAAAARRAAAAESAKASGMLESAGTLFDTAAQLELSENFMQPGSIVAQAPGELITFGANVASGIFGAEERANSILSDLAARNTFSKTAEDFVIQLGEEIGANSNAQRQSIRDSFANIELDTGTIFYATAREIDRLLSRAEAQELEVPNVEQYRATARRLKELAALSPAQRRIELQNMRGGRPDNAPQPPIRSLFDTSAIQQGAQDLGASITSTAGDLAARGQQIGAQASGLASELAGRADNILQSMREAGAGDPMSADRVRRLLESLPQAALDELSPDQRQSLTRLYQEAQRLSQSASSTVQEFIYDPTTDQLRPKQ